MLLGHFSYFLLEIFQIQKLLFTQWNNIQSDSATLFYMSSIIHFISKDNIC
jgi:hypothetical protein